ncbi:MAG: hypothetical protein E4H10_05110 [Bacteroidia bacterium]|nr:MAG: hypothetical protein E4H10_05110 [Bacteroidia bacterium]
MRYSKYVLILMALTLVGCPWYGYKYPNGKLPDTPVNLEAFNTEYDDYNSTAPTLGRFIPFCFSTNRQSQGGEFNVLYAPMNVEFSKTSGELKVSQEYGWWSAYGNDFGLLLEAVKKVNITGNELGPYLMFEPYAEISENDFVLLFATDREGDYEIAYTFNGGTAEFSEIQPVAFLNSGFNDLYPSFNSDLSKIYFCSDREDGVFNIFQVSVNYADDSIIGVLSDTEPHEVVRDEILSGEYDDKCPFIFENTLVLTSNRPGGYGGFDLYYSKFEGGAWSTPVNFGPAINSASDEYRPILFEEEVDEDRNMMIFSSNRPGGKGGFDLYFVGVME